MRQRRISYGKAEILEQKATVSLKADDYGTVSGNSIGFSGAIRIIRFKRRYYTVYGRCFGVAGKNIEYSAALNMRHYTFLDWNELRDMVAE